MVMPGYNNTPSAAPTYSRSFQAIPAHSPDGRYLAVVTSSPDNDNTLHVIDLNTPSADPVTASGGNRGDNIFFTAFTPDNASVYYIAGGANGDDNTLYRLDVAGGGAQTVLRGNFSDWARLSPDGNQLAVAEWRAPIRPRGPAFLDTVLIHLADGSRSVLYEGVADEDAEEINYRFALPLYWAR